MSQSSSSPVIVWWIVWAAVTAGLVVIFFTVQPEAVQLDQVNLRYVPILPLVASAIVRWLLLPRLKERTRAFPLFVIGIALAEGCGLTGIFLVPDLRPTYLALGLLALAQFVPFFASRLRS